MVYLFFSFRVLWAFTSFSCIVPQVYYKSMSRSRGKSEKNLKGGTTAHYRSFSTNKEALLTKGFYKNCHWLSHNRSCKPFCHIASFPQCSRHTPPNPHLRSSLPQFLPHTHYLPHEPYQIVRHRIATAPPGIHKIHRNNPFKRKGKSAKGIPEPNPYLLILSYEVDSWHTRLLSNRFGRSRIRNSSLRRRM